MRLPETVYRRLVVCNTAVLLGLMLVALVGAYKARDNLHRRLSSFVESELVASRLFGPGRAAADAGFDQPMDIPLYDLQLGPQAWRDIQVQVQKLLPQRIMTNADKVWHPVRLLHEGEQYKGKIRLRGDLPNHWAGGKKSWRIKFKKDKLLHGIRELDLIIPADRAFEQEKVAYDAARELGVLAADAGFCLVRINGVDMGLYLWVEKYGPEMLEKLGYPAGEIFREDNTWTQRYHTRFGLPARGEPARTYSYFAANFTNTVRDDSALGFYAQRWDRFLSERVGPRAPFGFRRSFDDGFLSERQGRFQRCGLVLRPRQTGE